MPTTDRGYPYPVLGDPANVPADLGSLAGMISADLNRYSYSVMANGGAVGDGVADDTAAIQVAFTAAAAAVPTTTIIGSSPVVYFPPAAGYRTTSSLTVPDGVDVIMQGPILYDGAAGTTALNVGSGVRTMRRHHRLWVRRVTLASWTNFSDVGIKIRTHYYGEIHIKEVRGFDTGLYMVGTGTGGCVHNQVWLGDIADNRIGVRLTQNTNGWCNENIFYGGSFLSSSTTHTSIDRFGVYITSEDGTYLNNNANLFLKPSFEIGGDAAIPAEGTCVYIEHGSMNSFLDCRVENPSATVMKTFNDSSLNVFTTQYNSAGVDTPVVQDNGTYASSMLLNRNNSVPIDRCNKLVYRVDNIHRRACYYDGGTALNMPGLTTGTSSTSNTDARANTSYTLNADSVEFGSARLLGFYVSTKNAKRFTLVTDTDTGFGGRIKVRCYDNAGAIISTGTPIRRSNSTTFTYATSHGGAWTSGSDSTLPIYFEVSAAVETIFVMVTGGTAVIKVRSIALYTMGDSIGASAWTAQVDNGDNWGTTPPTAGTWEDGRRVLNDAPASGGPPGWVCTTAGTPGTWSAMANLA